MSWSSFTNTKAIDKWQYRHKSGVGSYGSWTDVLSSTKSTQTYAVPSLTAGTEYTFEVRALNTGGVAVAGPFGPAKGTPTATTTGWTRIVVEGTHSGSRVGSPRIRARSGGSPWAGTPRARPTPTPCGPPQP